MTQTTHRNAWTTAQSQGLDRLDAQMLLLHVLSRPSRDRAWLLAHDDDQLADAHAQAFDRLVQRRLGGEPLAYLVGHKEFFGLHLTVNSSVLVPRPDTETLVDWALEHLLGDAAVAQPRVLDMGTGSGAVAVALAHTLQRHHQPAYVLAVDNSPEALATAQANAARLDLNIQFLLSDWFDSIDAMMNDRFNVIVSNPPYIADADPHLTQLTHEPLQALTAGADGLADLRRIVEQAPAHLQVGGWLLLEHGHDQSAAVRALLVQHGFAGVQSRRDLSGIERCSGGRYVVTAG